MTHFHYEPVECKYCLNEEEIVVWDMIDLADDPDLEDKILHKDLQNFICHNCQRNYLLEKPFLLIDRAKKSLIYYHPGFNESLADMPREKDGRLAAALRGQLPTDFGFETKGFRLRLVTDYNDLIEKLHIARCGLSDRLIEVVKLAMEARLNDEDQLAWEKAAAENPELEEYTNQAFEQKELHFLGQEGPSLLFQRHTSGLGWRQLELSSEVYDRAELLLSARLPEEGSWDAVDRTWALAFSASMNP